MFGACCHLNAANRAAKVSLQCIAVREAEAAPANLALGARPPTSLTAAVLVRLLASGRDITLAFLYIVSLRAKRAAQTKCLKVQAARGTHAAGAAALPPAHLAPCPHHAAHTAAQRQHARLQRRHVLAKSDLQRRQEADEEFVDPQEQKDFFDNPAMGVAYQVRVPHTGASVRRRVLLWAQRLMHCVRPRQACASLQTAHCHAL